MRFFTGSTAGSSTGTERMRIDSSGNLLVGKTAVDFSVDGVAAQPSGVVGVTRNGGAPLILNRKTSNGDMAIFQKDGVPVGSIGSVASNYLSIGTGDTGILFQDDNDFIEPCNVSTSSGRDAAIDLGTATSRFKDLYLSGGVYLGGTGSANHLDDYEEGTWTPRYTAASGGNLGGTQQSLGRYTKIGRMVHVKIYIYINNISVSGKSGSVHISGLPFTVADVGGSSANATSTTQSTATFGVFTTAPTHATTEVGTTQIDLFKPLASQAENKLQVTDFATGGGNRNYLRFDMTYETT
jgi:hypothetical protein